MASGHDAKYCSNCGEAVAPSDDFCSDCGAELGGGTDREFRRRVEDLTVQGWDVKHDYGDRVVLIDRGFGSWGVHALLAVFTGGLGNVVYAWYSYSLGADEIELRKDGTERYVAGGPDDGTGLQTKQIASSVLLALFGLGILDGGVDSIVSAFLAVTFLGAALFVFPPTGRRLRDREPVTEFGWVQSTDETTVTDPDAPCTACSSPIETGVERTYRERFCVAGVPLFTSDEGQNRYCRACANGARLSTRTRPERSGRTDRTRARE